MTHVVFSQPGPEEKVVGPGKSIPDLNTDPDLREILNFGVKHAISQGIEYGKVPNASYYIEDALSLDVQLMLGGEWTYRFSVLLGNDEGSERKLNFIVTKGYFGGERKVTSVEFAQDSGQQGSPFGSWESISVTEPDANKKLNDILKFGMQKVLAKGIADGQLLTANYQRSKIYSIKKQKVKGTDYRFNLKLQNDEDGYIHVIFVVNDHWADLLPPMKLTSYLFLDIQETVSQPNEETKDEAFDG